MVASTISQQADIDYMPDHDNHLARSKRRQETEELAMHLPEGFPAQLSGDLVWDARTIADRYDWNYQLSIEDISEIDAALRYFQCMWSFSSLPGPSAPTPFNLFQP